MGFGGWSSWQVITLIICFGVAIGFGAISSKRKKK